MSTKKLQVYKENGEKQRPDVGLTQEIASALVQRIFSGETLYPPERKIEILLPDENGEEKPVILSSFTINTWIKRDIVIPETGKTLRALLDEAREVYRTKKQEKRREKMLDKVEHELNRTINLRTSEPVIGMFGKIYDKQGNLVRRENPALLKVKMDTVKFLAERLKPDVYGKVEKAEHKVMHFSLADLRQAKKEMQEQEAQKA